VMYDTTLAAVARTENRLTILELVMGCDAAKRNSKIHLVASQKMPRPGHHCRYCRPCAPNSLGGRGGFDVSPLKALRDARM
jgi:hypothetical protein